MKRIYLPLTGTKYVLSEEVFNFLIGQPIIEELHVYTDHEGEYYHPFVTHVYSFIERLIGDCSPYGGLDLISKRFFNGLVEISRQQELKRLQ